MKFSLGFTYLLNKLQIVILLLQWSILIREGLRKVKGTRKEMRAFNYSLCISRHLMSRDWISGDIVPKETSFMITFWFENIINSLFQGQIISRTECPIYIIDSRREGKTSCLYSRTLSAQ